MSLIGVSCVRGYVSMYDHMGCMMDPLHPCQFTPDVLGLMTGANTEREASGVRYSPSTLLGCYRQDVLSQKKDWYVNVEQAWKQVRGSMIHAMMEDTPPWPGSMGTIRELRMKADVPTKYGMQTFMGKADLIVLNRIENINVEYTNELGLLANRIEHVLHVTVVDYKTVGDVGHRDQADEKHERQVNLYAWLVRETLAQYVMATIPPNMFDEVVLPDEVQLAEFTAYEAFKQIDRVVVDEIQIFYADFSKARRFTSKGNLTARGKRHPDHVTYDTLDLKRLRLMKHEAATRWIASHIEQRIEAEDVLPPPLPYEERAFSGEAFVCQWCAVRKDCVTIGKAEGYDMHGQGEDLE